MAARCAVAKNVTWWVLKPISLSQASTFIHIHTNRCSSRLSKLYVLNVRVKCSSWLFRLSNVQYFFFLNKRANHANMWFGRGILFLWSSITSSERWRMVAKCLGHSGAINRDSSAITFQSYSLNKFATEFSWTYIFSYHTHTQRCQSTTPWAHTRVDVVTLFCVF
jgi:hypothetical protein